MEFVLWFVFILSAVVLIAVVLLQEPKGGGLAEAFGGMGAQTFGVKATGITKFTAYVAVVFMLSAIMLTCVGGGDKSVMDGASTPPAETGLPTGPSDVGAPADTDTRTPPATDDEGN